jgi:acid phosphatase (class A)
MRFLWYLTSPLIGVVLSFYSVAWAADASYLAPADVDLVQILAPPPVPESAAQKADLQAVIDAQNARTDGQIQRVQADDARTVFRFADVLGPNFRRENLPFATSFFERVFEDGEAATTAAKTYFKRPRPFVIDPDIKKLVEQPPTPSYPSAHSTFAYDQGILLAIMVPEKASAIFDRAAEYAHNRVIAGVHFPTDIEAGRIAASVIDYALLHNARFVPDFERAKAEVRQALGLK